MHEVQPKHFPKSIKNDCCLLITDHVDTKLQREKRFNFTCVGSSRDLGLDLKQTGSLVL